MFFNKEKKRGRKSHRFDTQKCIPSLFHQYISQSESCYLGTWISEKTVGKGSNQGAVAVGGFCSVGVLGNSAQRNDLIIVL